MVSYFRNIGFFLLGLIMIWALGFGGFSATSLNLKPSDPRQPVEAIVVLTGGKDRIENGLLLLAQRRAKNMFITGVHPNVRVRHIQALWKDTKQTLPECCITLDYDATSTTENAIKAQSWIEENAYKNVVLVTSDYHIIRAAIEFKSLMPDVKFLINPVKQSDIKVASRLYWRILFTEYHKSIFRMWEILSSKVTRKWNDLL